MALATVGSLSVLQFMHILVKLWSTKMEHSVATLEAKANVCCVKFNPSSRYNIAFGSAGKVDFIAD